MTAYRLTYAIAKVLIGGVFIYTGIIHSLDPHGFAQAILAYQILPAWSINFFALCLPWVELLAGLAIATGIFVRGGALAVIGMLSVFSIALVAALYHGLDISCGCFSTSPDAAQISWLYLVRDIALLAPAFFIFQHPWLAGKAHRSPSTLEKLLVPVLVMIIVAGIFLFQALTRDPCEGVYLDRIAKHMDLPSAALASKRPIGGLCEVLVKTGKGMIPIYVGDTFIITGEMFRDKKNITMEGFSRIKAKNFLALRGEAEKAVAFSYRPAGPIAHTLYLFASPTCPHCEEVLGQIKPLLETTHTELKVLFMAKAQAKALAVSAVCQTIDLDIYLSKTWISPQDKPQRTCAVGLETVKRSNALADKLGINQVPTFYTAQGQMLVGADMQTLRRLLKD